MKRWQKSFFASVVVLAALGGYYGGLLRAEGERRAAWDRAYATGMADGADRVRTTVARRMDAELDRAQAAIAAAREAGRAAGFSAAFDHIRGLLDRERQLTVAGK